MRQKTRQNLAREERPHDWARVSFGFKCSPLKGPTSLPVFSGHIELQIEKFGKLLCLRAVPAVCDMLRNPTEVWIYSL